jgi:hypothetical protein
MMEIYSSNTSEIIRHDFMRFNRRSGSADVRTEKETRSSEAKMRESLDQYRAEMANDDGKGSYGTYKCPIF